MRVVWSWFTNWTDQQKHQFIDILVSKAVPRKVSSLLGAQAAQAHYLWVRASEVIWSEYTSIISVLSGWFKRLLL